jgi:flagellar motility protein MotE (MotC chaperone)
MTRLLREFRLVPVVLVAIGCLFVLKTVGLIADGGYTLGGSRAPLDNFGTPKTVTLSSPAIALTNPAEANKPSWAKEMFGFPSSGPTPVSLDITGAVGETKPPEPAKDASKDPKASAAVPQTVPAASQKTVPLDGPRPLSAAERAVLERLQERRTELEARTRELEMRENLLRAAEQRVEARATELKEMEARVTAASSKRDEAETVRMKSLVTMYENMKAKDAARIFDRLDLKILVDVTNQINPRRMADILANMSSEAAERLTVELASRAALGERSPGSSPELPKIEGRPGG